jgi:hypothetical protein
LSDYGVGVGIDAAGDILVVGAEDTGGPAVDFWSRKYDSDGATLWSSLVGGEGNGSDDFRAVVTTPGGTSWSSGSITSQPNIATTVLMRRDPQGGVVWTRELNVVGSGDGWRAVARAHDGRIGVAGVSMLPFPNDFEAHFAVYPP